MRHVLSIAAILSGLLLVMNVLKGPYIFIPLGIIALAVVLLSIKPKPEVIEKVSIPNKEKLEEKIEDAEDKFHEDKKINPGTGKIQSLIDKLRKR